MKNMPYVILFLIGTSIGWLLKPEMKTVDKTEITSRDTTYIVDTVEVEIPVFMSMLEKPDSVSSIVEEEDTLIVSKKTFDTEFAEIEVTIISPDTIKSIQLSVIPRPMKIEYVTKEIEVQTLKTVYIQPNWTETRTIGIVIGSVATVILVLLAGSLK